MSRCATDQASPDQASDVLGGLLARLLADGRLPPLRTSWPRTARYRASGEPPLTDSRLTPL